MTIRFSLIPQVIFYQLTSKKSPPGAAMPEWIARHLNPTQTNLVDGVLLSTSLSTEAFLNTERKSVWNIWKQLTAQKFYSTSRGLSCSL